jgi:GntR family transcriptional regulator, vanillate catabolism transcriptional regulator
MAKADSPLALQIKQMILAEELAPGERITEVGLSERLGVSRTPIRNLLPRLAAEGFLQPVGKRGYAIAGLADEEMLDALDLRSPGAVPARQP